MKRIIVLVCLFSRILLSSNAISKPELKTKNEAASIVIEQPVQFSFLIPELAGTLRLGLINVTESRWPEQLKSIQTTAKSGNIDYKIKDSFLGTGELVVKAIGLTSTDGLILQLEATNTPDGLELFWAAGGASGKQADKNTGLFKTDYCKDNVFVMERNDLTIFYGESMKLKTINFLFPVETESALADAHQQTSPLIFLNSGKKTDSPVLAGKFKLVSGKKYYICVYRQNKEADYDYSLLPEVFSKAVSK
jgi:hypothetical protein